MSKKVEEVVEEIREEKAQDTPDVSIAFQVKVFSNGAIGIEPLEGFEKIEEVQIEAITRQISEDLRDNRIAQKALEVFKSRF